jgi:SAM-dependent methyltransferase
MNRSTDREWEEWGRKDPYFGVLIKRRYRADLISENKKEFFLSGEKHIANAIATVEKRYGAIAKNQCLDFGCGVGRLIIPLSSRFRQVVGLDISPSMLKEAHRNLEERSIRNVELGPSDDELSFVAGRKFDFVHSYITLQHVATERGYAIYERMLDLLDDQGAFFAQFCVGRRMPPLISLAYHVKRLVPAAKYPLNIMRGKPWNEPSMQMNIYDIRKIVRIAKKKGFSEVTLYLEDAIPDGMVGTESICVVSKR